MSLTLTSPANFINNGSSSEIAARPHPLKKEVLCTVVLDCTYRMEAHFKNIYTNYLIPYFSQLRNPLTINVDGKPIKITPSLKISIILYRSYDSVNESIVKYFSPVDNMEFIKKVLENIDFSWSNYQCSAATEGLCQALSVHENYYVKEKEANSQSPSRHCILIGNTNPDTAKSHLNPNYKYDDLSLDDICKRLKKLETNFSIITPRNNLTDLLAIQNKINGNATQAIELDNDKCSGYIVRFAGISAKETNQAANPLKPVPSQEKRALEENLISEVPESKAVKIDTFQPNVNSASQLNQAQSNSGSLLPNNSDVKIIGPAPIDALSPSKRSPNSVPPISNHILSPEKFGVSNDAAKVADLPNNNVSTAVNNVPVPPAKPKRQPSKSGRVAANKKQTPKNPPKVTRKSSSKRGSISGPTPTAIPLTIEEKNNSSIAFTNAANSSNVATPAPQMTPNYGASSALTPVQVGSAQNTPADFNNFPFNAQTANLTNQNFGSTQASTGNYAHPSSIGFNGENPYAINSSSVLRLPQNNLQMTPLPNQLNNQMSQSGGDSSQRINPNQPQNLQRNAQNQLPASLPHGINPQNSRNSVQQPMTNASPAISGTPNLPNSNGKQQSTPAPTIPLNVNAPIWSGELGFNISSASPMHSAYANINAFPLATGALSKDELMVDKWPKRLLISRTVQVSYATIGEATKTKGLPIFMISSSNADTNQVYTFMLERISDGTAFIVDLVHNGGNKFGFLLMKKNDKFIVVAFLKSPFPDFGAMPKPNITQPNPNTSQGLIPAAQLTRPTNSVLNGNNTAFRTTIANNPSTLKASPFNDTPNINQVARNGNMGHNSIPVSNNIGGNVRTPNDITAISQHMTFSSQSMASRTPNLSKELQNVPMQNAPSFNSMTNSNTPMNRTVTPNNGQQLSQPSMLPNVHLNVAQPGNLNQLAPNQLNILRSATLNNMINPNFNGGNGMQGANLNMAMVNPNFNPALPLSNTNLINPLLPNNNGYLNPQMYMNPEMMQMAQQNRNLQQFGLQNMSQQQLQQLNQMQNNPRQFNPMN